MGAATSVFFDIIGRDQASDKFDKVANSAGRAQGKMSKFGSMLKTGVKAGMIGVGIAAVGAGKALFDMAQGAAEDQAAATRLATTLKNTTGATKGQVAAVEDWISKQGQLYGVSDDELRPALGKLAAATHDVGKAQKLASLAMDISAGSGKSLESVSTALAKAQNGSVAGLSKLGISTKDAAGKTIDFATAQKRLSDTFKGQASKQADTYEGRMKRLKVALSETGESIGYTLMPILTKLAGWFVSKGLPALQTFGNWLSQHIPPIFDKVKAVIAKFTGDGSGKFSKFMSDAKSIFSNAVSFIQGLWHAFGANIVSYLGKTLKNAVTILGGAFKIIKGIFEVFSGIIHGDWKKVWSGVKDILRGAVGVLRGIVSQLWNLITFTFKNAGVILKGIFKGIWNGIKDLARAGASGLVSLVQGIPGSLKNLGGKFLDAGRTLIGKLWAGIRNAAGNAGGFVADLLGKIRSGINNVLHLPLELNFDKGPIHIHATLIPAFAKGTNFAPGGLSLVGERGPELVDLPRGSRVIPNNRIGSYSGNGTVININVSGALDPVQAARQIEKVLRDMSRQTGRAPVISAVR